MSPSTTTNMTSVLHRIGMWFSMALLFAIAVLNLTEFDSSIKISAVKPGTWTPHSSSISSFLSTDPYARDSSISSWSLALRFLPQEPAVTTSSAPFFSRRKSTLLSKTPTGLSKHRLELRRRASLHDSDLSSMEPPRSISCRRATRFPYFPTQRSACRVKNLPFESVGFHQVAQRVSSFSHFLPFGASSAFISTADPFSDILTFPLLDQTFRATTPRNFLLFLLLSNHHGERRSGLRRCCVRRLRR